MYADTFDTEPKKLLILGSVTFLTVQTLLVCSIRGDLMPMYMTLAHMS